MLKAKVGLLKRRSCTLNILILTQYFPPEVGAPQARLSEFAKHWAGTGNQVSVLTGVPNHPTGIVHPGYKKLFCRAEETDGYRVIRTAIYTTPNSGFLKKTLGHLSFMASSLLIGSWRTTQSDVVMVSSPQFFAIFSAWLLARIKRARFVLEIRDLWPAIFVDLKIIRSKWLIRLLEMVELFFYRRADHIVVVTNGFKKNISQRGIPDDKISVITNGVDTTRFRPTEHSNDIRSRCGAKPDQVLVLYIGAHGISQGLDIILDAAEHLNNNHRLHFVLVGDGARRADLLHATAERQLSNLTMLPSVTKACVNQYIATADIALVTLRDIAGFDTFIPSKLFELMGAGIPIIASLRGEAAQIANNAGACVVSPGDPVALAAAIEEMVHNKHAWPDIVKKQRTHVLQYFDREKLSNDYLELFKRLITR